MPGKTGHESREGSSKRAFIGIRHGIGEIPGKNSTREWSRASSRKPSNDSGAA